MTTIKNVIIFVEGQTEEAFIKEVVAPALFHLHIYLHPQMIKTSASGRGGAITYERFKFHTRNTLRQRKDCYLTTFFDLYGLDNNFPQFAETTKINAPQDKAEHLEAALQQHIVSEFDIREERFFPHIQPYEYEGLLFSDVEKLTQTEPEWRKYQNELADIRAGFASPEHINNSYETAPSKRLEKVLTPKYAKVRHGPIIAKKITLATIENECQHFKSWIDKLRAL